MCSQKMKSQFIPFIIIILAVIYVKCENLDKFRQSVTNEEQRAFIKVSVLLDTSPRVVSSQLETALPQGHLGQSTAYRWYGDFKEGRRTSIEDLPIQGRPRVVTTEDNKEKIKQLILESDGM